jgi:hypothetical protein
MAKKVKMDNIQNVVKGLFSPEMLSHEELAIMCFCSTKILNKMDKRRNKQW